jgi:hypothetical protein
LFHFYDSKIDAVHLIAFLQFDRLTRLDEMASWRIAVAFFDSNNSILRSSISYFLPGSLHASKQMAKIGVEVEIVGL